MSVQYSVVDTQGSLISKTFPYTRQFFAINPSPNNFAYLTLQVQTGYSADQASESAIVLLNGHKIGALYPTFVSAASDNLYIGAPATFFFSQKTVLSPAWFNTLEIHLQGNLDDSSNYVIVYGVLCTYQEVG